MIPMRIRSFAFLIFLVLTRLAIIRLSHSLD
jgi:hypothetical protein